MISRISAKGGKREISDVGRWRAPAAAANEDNSDEWPSKCHNGGNLVCYDNCPAAWHVECIPGEQRTAAQLPSNWSCPACATAAATLAA